jgi:hypothetical protein
MTFHNLTVLSGLAEYDTSWWIGLVLDSQH